MDIEVSSNFERALWWAYGQDGEAVAALMDELKQGSFRVSENAMGALTEHYSSGRVSEAETRAEIARIREETGEVICPHTAVGTRVARDHLGETPVITLATAHPAKFPAAVEEATGYHAGLPKRMADLYERPERVTRVAADLDALETLIRERRTA